MCHVNLDIPKTKSITEIGPSGQGTVSSRQFIWGIGLPKGNGGVQMFPPSGQSFWR